MSLGISHIQAPRIETVQPRTGFKYIANPKISTVQSYITA